MLVPWVIAAALVGDDGADTGAVELREICGLPAEVAAEVATDGALEVGDGLAEGRDDPRHLGDPLVGVWQRFESHAEGDRIRFYYFHGDGQGLYRYGKVGLTNTHAFDYAIDGSRLRLDFRKTGEVARIGFEVAADAERPERTWLTLQGDPRDGPGRYFRDPRVAAACDLVVAAADGENRGIGGRLWSDERRFTAGGLGFAMYQFQPQTIDGRGVGWFHRGDYDEWTTEALTYRRQGERLTLHFMLSGESATSQIAVEKAAEGERELVIADDPRDFWHSHRYRDRGPTFAGADASARGGLLPVFCGLGYGEGSGSSPHE